VDSGAAAAERVENGIAGVRGGIEDAFEQGDRFLRGVAEAFFRLRVKFRNTLPKTPHWNTLTGIEILLPSRGRARA